MTTRTYRQTRRADATERTRGAILDAARALFRADPQLDPSLDAVAARAGVSTRTVIRQFGSKEGLLEAAIAAGVEATRAARHAEPGDVDGAVGAIVAHYEAMGDDVMRWLALADRLPVVRRVTERGTESHLDWVDAVFAPGLAGLPRGERRARRAALATATDVYVWHLLRRREGLGREATRRAMREMVEAVRGGEATRSDRVGIATSGGRGARQGDGRGAAGRDARPGRHAEPESDARPARHAKPEPGAHAERGAGAESGAGAEGGAGADPGAGAERGAGTERGAGAEPR